MDDLVEKVARAIWESADPYTPWEDAGHVRKGECLRHADAAVRSVLDGIREPDDAMTAAGKLAGDVDDLDHTPAEIKAIFGAMIDELRERYSWKEQSDD